MIIILLIVPLVHIGFVILIGIANYYTTYGMFLHWLWMLGELLFLPYAIRYGYYPSKFEYFHMSPFDYVLAVGFVMLFWILSAYITALILRRLRPLTRFKLLVLTICFVTCIGVAVISRMANALPPLPDTVTITIDTNQPLGEFPLHHRGFSQGGEGQMMQAGYFERAMDIMVEIRPRYIRIDHLYDYYNVLSFDEGGEPIYDFSELDRIVDAIIEAGVQPLMSLSYAPPAMNPESVYTRPNDLDVWGDLVYETVRYYNIERGLNIQYWEVWNEPNLLAFWEATIQDYLDLYDVTARAVKRADASAFVGGPATSSGAVGLPIMYRFTEESWVTGLINYIQKNDLPLDFVSWHRYDTSAQVFTDDIAVHERWLDGLNPKPQMLLTEWNYTGGKSSVMDTGQSVAYLAQMLSIFVESNLEQVFYFEPIDGGDSWISSWGLIRADGTPKPSFYAFTLFDRLEGMQLFTESNHPNVGAIATQSDDNVIILTWNNTGFNTTPSILIDSFPQESIVVDLYGVDSLYGNTYYEDGTSETFIESFSIDATTDGLFNITLEIPKYGIRLFEISLNSLD